MVTAYTPGPNNVLALYAVSQNGWNKGKNFILGISAGFFSVMALCALFCYELAAYFPSAVDFLKYAGAAYITYLAVHVALSKPGGGADRQISFLRGLLLQFVNVKIILYAITIYTGYVLPYGKDLGILLVHAMVMTAIGVSGTLTWAAAGGVFQKFLAAHYRPFNIAMASVLLYCAASLAFGF